MIDIQELKAMAEAATQGEWTCGDKPEGRFWQIGCGNQAIGATHSASKKHNPEYAAMFEKNAKHIAAANPTAVLELIAELQGYQQGAEVEAQAADEARAEVRRLKAENESLRKQLNDVLDCSTELRKDAERYCYLRNEEHDVAVTFGGHQWEDLSSEYMDNAIDAAMIQEQQS